MITLQQLPGWGGIGSRCCNSYIRRSWGLGPREVIIAMGIIYLYMCYETLLILFRAGISVPVKAFLLKIFKVQMSPSDKNEF